MEDVPSAPPSLDHNDDDDGEHPIALARSTKRRRILSNSEDDDSGADHHKLSEHSLANQDLKPAPLVKKQIEASQHLKENDGHRPMNGSPEKHVKTNADLSTKPPVSSFFAPRPKTVPKLSVASVEKSTPTASEPDDATGKRSDSEAHEEIEHHHKEEEEGEDEDEDEDEDDDGMDEEAAGKLADIFTKKAPVASSGVDWKAGSPVPYAALVATFSLIESTKKRLEISAFLTHFLVQVIQKTPGDLLKTVYLCINRLGPDYEGLELGIGESLLMKAVGESTGRNLAQIKTDFRRVGDLGKVAQESRETQKTLFAPKALTVNSVFGVLKDVAKTAGSASQARKVGLINKLLASCKGQETMFIIRSLEGKLRIGLAEKTILVSVAHAVVNAEIAKQGKKLSREKMASELERGANIVKAVFSELPTYDKLIPALLEQGIDHIQEVCFLTPGIPLKPMLAKPTKAITEVLDRFEGRRFTCEYKYDGERAQVHKLEDGSIKIFSRNSEDMSVKYPDIMAQLPACINEGTTSFVIDAEAVAWDPLVKRLLPFQELSRRKRKDVRTEDITVKVHLFAFDLLYLNGKPLLNENLERRRELMYQSLKPVEGEFAFATSDDATEVDDIQTFLDKSMKDGCEGLMVKMLVGEGASYEPSRRSIHWLKLKKDYLKGVGDSFDLVVIGGDYGRGKRTNVYGAFHLACYDAESGTYQSICKLGTGFSEEDLQKHYDFLSPLELTVKKGYYDVGTGKPPDVYFEPRMVWEVLAADLSLSPIYTAAKGLCGERGISLRFPRFIRIRDDKSPEDSTGPDQVAEAYRRQATAAPAGKFGKKGGGGGDDDGFW